jgi:hypothetical protein
MAEHVATVCCDGGVLRVVRAPNEVGIADASPVIRLTRPAQARELVALLDQAMSDDAPGVVGSVLMTNGRLLHVKRWACHVGLSELADAHSGWVFRMRDHVEALRDALDTAASTTPGASPNVRTEAPA